MPAIYTLTVRDYSDEYSRVSFNTPEPAADGTDWAANLALHAALQAAVDALCIGNLAREQFVAYVEPLNDARPANQYAQRETGLRLFWVDATTGQKGHWTIPCPDLSLIANPGSDQVDLTVSVVGTLVSAIEALAVSPAGNSIEIYKGVIVGRRS